MNDHNLDAFKNGHCVFGMAKAIDPIPTESSSKIVKKPEVINPQKHREELGKDDIDDAHGIVAGSTQAELTPPCVFNTEIMEAQSSRGALANTNRNVPEQQTSYYWMNQSQIRRPSGDCMLHNTLFSYSPNYVFSIWHTKVNALKLYSQSNHINFPFDSSIREFKT